MPKMNVGLDSGGHIVAKAIVLRSRGLNGFGQRICFDQDSSCRAVNLATGSGIS